MTVDRRRCPSGGSEELEARQLRELAEPKQSIVVLHDDDDAVPIPQGQLSPVTQDAKAFAALVEVLQHALSMQVQRAVQHQREGAEDGCAPHRRAIPGQRLSEAEMLLGVTVKSVLDERAFVVTAETQETGFCNGRGR